MNYKILSIVIILLISVSGFYVFSGYFIKDPRIDSIVESTNKWLDSDEGKKAFPGIVATEPYEVLNFEKTDVVVWLIPLKGPDGLFVGYIETAETSFDRAPVYTVFAEPSEIFFKKNYDYAYEIMLEHTDYSAAQITKPILIAHRSTIMWYSQVFSGLEEIDYLEVSAMWPFDDLYDKNGKIKISEEEQYII